MGNGFISFLSVEYEYIWNNRYNLPSVPLAREATISRIMTAQTNAKGRVGSTLFPKVKGALGAHVLHGDQLGHDLVLLYNGVLLSFICKAY